MIKEKTLRTLEYNKIMEQVAELSSFSGGKELAREMIPTVNLEEARAWQAETAEVVAPGDCRQRKIPESWWCGPPRFAVQIGV